MYCVLVHRHKFKVAPHPVADVKLVTNISMHLVYGSNIQFIRQ